MAEPADLTFVGASTWVEPNSNSTVSPTYPDNLVESDVVYAILHIKPDTATVGTPADWSLVGAASGGGGSQGNGTGPTRVHVYKRTVPAGGLTGSQAFSITGGNSLGGTMHGWRANGSNIIWDAEVLTSYSRATASTNFGGTGAATVSGDVKDAIVVVIGCPDDAASNINITSLTVPGSTLGTLSQQPAGTGINSFGQDQASAAAYALITTGAESGAPSVTVSSNSAETGMGLFFRVSAQRDPAVTHEGAAAVTATATITVAGVILVVHEGQATLSAAATITAAAVVTAPDAPSPTSSEPGYGQPGAIQVGTVWTTTAMGGDPTIEAQAALTATATVSATGAIEHPATAALTITATSSSSGEWWGAVRGLSATPISQSRIDLAWDAVFAATGYDIERDGVIIAQDVTDLFYIDQSGLVASTEYDYRVAAVPVQ